MPLPQPGGECGFVRGHGNIGRVCGGSRGGGVRPACGFVGGEASIRSLRGIDNSGSARTARRFASRERRIYGVCRVRYSSRIRKVDGLVGSVGCVGRANGVDDGRSARKARGEAGVADNGSGVVGRGSSGKGRGRCGRLGRCRRRLLIREIDGLGHVDVGGQEWGAVGIEVSVSLGDERGDGHAPEGAACISEGAGTEAAMWAAALGG
ncbi:MAG: hypothetical protein AAF184_25145 [Pseudomonadota bacterium]